MIAMNGSHRLGGLALVAGTGEVADIDRLEQTAGYAAIRRAQAGLLADMDSIADVLYDRA